MVFNPPSLFDGGIVGQLFDFTDGATGIDMTETVFLGLVVAGTSIITAILGVALQGWLGAKQATNVEAQTGLNALMAGIDAANKMAETLNTKLQWAEARIVAIERQAYQVLSENNRFRVIHGVDPTHSLEGFEPIPKETWDEFVKRIGRVTQ